MQLIVNRGKAKGRVVRINTPRFLIGRDPECQLRPQSDAVSRHHAELSTIAGILVIKDLGSSDGTRVNGRRLDEPTTLRSGDVIEIGPLSFSVLLDEAKRPGRPRRTAEDEIASWLIDEEDEDEDAYPAPPRAPVAVTTGTAPTAVARKPADAGREDAFELLKAMTMPPE